MRGTWLSLLLVGCLPRLYSDGSGDGGVWQPPENDWPFAAPPDGLVGQGFTPGDVVPDFRGNDQFGNEVAMWQFYGNVVLVDISTMWCDPCRELALDAEETARDYADEGFVYLTVLHEDQQGDPPTQADLNSWAAFPASFGSEAITGPIMADPKGSGGSAPAVLQGQYPALILVDRELHVVERVEPASDANIRAAVESEL